MITFQNVIDHKDIRWDRQGVSTNPNVTFQNVIENINMNWCWYSIAANPSIFKIRSDDPDYIDFAIKTCASNRIKRRWFRCITNPEYAMCKKRLMSEFKVYTNII
jgi:hypothetical protein